jgi:hypothetical protein
MGRHVLVVVSFSHDGAPICKCGAVAEWRPGDPSWGKVPGYYFPCRPGRPGRLRQLAERLLDVTAEAVHKVVPAGS